MADLARLNLPFSGAPCALSRALLGNGEAGFVKGLQAKKGHRAGDGNQ